MMSQWSSQQGRGWHLLGAEKLGAEQSQQQPNNTCGIVTMGQHRNQQQQKI